MTDLTDVATTPTSADHYAAQIAMLENYPDSSIVGSYQQADPVSISDSAIVQGDPDLQAMNDLVFSATGLPVTEQSIDVQNAHVPPQQADAPQTEPDRQPDIATEPQDVNEADLAAQALNQHPFNPGTNASSTLATADTAGPIEDPVVNGDPDKVDEDPEQQQHIIDDILSNRASSISLSTTQAAPGAQGYSETPSHQPSPDEQLTELNAQFNLSGFGGGTLSEEASVSSSQFDSQQYDDYFGDSLDGPEEEQLDDRPTQPIQDTRPMKDVSLDELDDQPPLPYGLQHAPTQPAGASYPVQNQQNLGASFGAGVANLVGGISSAVFSAASNLIQKVPKPTINSTNTLPDPVTPTPDNSINTTQVNGTTPVNADFGTFFDSRFEDNLNRLNDMSQSHSSVLDILESSELFKFAEQNKDLQDPQQLSEAKKRISALAEDHGTKAIMDSMVNINSNMSDLIDEISEEYANEPEKLAKMDELLEGWKDKYQQAIDKLDQLPLLDDVMASLKENINKLLDVLKGAINKITTSMN